MPLFPVRKARGGPGRREAARLDGQGAGRAAGRDQDRALGVAGVLYRAARVRHAGAPIRLPGPSLILEYVLILAPGTGGRSGERRLPARVPVGVLGRKPRFPDGPGSRDRTVGCLVPPVTTCCTCGREGDEGGPVVAGVQPG